MYQMKLLILAFLSVLASAAALADVHITYSATSVTTSRSGDATANDVTTGTSTATYSHEVGAFPEGGDGVYVSHSGDVIVTCNFTLTITLDPGSSLPSEVYVAYKVGNVGSAYASASHSTCYASSSFENYLQEGSAYVASHDTDTDTKWYQQSGVLDLDPLNTSSFSQTGAYTYSKLVGISAGTLHLSMYCFAPDFTYREAYASGTTSTDVTIIGLTHN
jgi:hypothetical protein